MEIRKVKINKAILVIGLILIIGFVSYYGYSKYQAASNSETHVEMTEKDSILRYSNDLSEQSEITCPKCGHKKIETLPTDVCLIAYNCEKCAAVLHPKEGDCCVFCTYGNHKCPSKQE